MNNLSFDLKLKRKIEPVDGHAIQTQNLNELASSGHERKLPEIR